MQEIFKIEWNGGIVNWYHIDNFKFAKKIYDELQTNLGKKRSQTELMMNTVR